MPVLPCPETPAVAAAAAAGTLVHDARLAAHVQICSHCLARVFGDVRRLRAERETDPGDPPPDGPPPG